MRSTPPERSQKAAAPFGLPRPVWLLGLASLFTDTASEAIYPILPIYLTRILGAGAVSLGIIEGFAEATSSLLKIISGRLSDRWNVRKPIVVAGYTLSSAVRPLVALVGSWPQLFAVRFVDRVGKGIRGAPRDALLAAAATPATRGRIFGFHRAMDHTGAIAGPLLASLFLLAWPGQYRWLFAATIVPGAAAVWMLLKVPPDPLEPGQERVRWPRRSAAGDAGGAKAGSPALEPGQERVRWNAEWGDLPRPYYALLGVLVLFTLGNSTDAFLLLRLTDAGVSPAFIPLLWALLHVVKALMSVWGGIRSDIVGRRALIGAGWIVYALVYAGFAMSTSPAALVAWFLLYGLYFGLTEGAEKALIADLAPANLRGTAFGLYNAALGVGGLFASVGFGVVWKVAGAPAAFAMGAVLSLVATALLFALIRDPARENPVPTPIAPAQDS